MRKTGSGPGRVGQLIDRRIKLLKRAHKKTAEVLWLLETIKAMDKDIRKAAKQ